MSESRRSCVSYVMKKIRQWAAHYLHFSFPALLISGLLVGHSVAEKKFLGCLILLLQDRMDGNFRKASIGSNIQGGLSNFLSTFFVYLGYNRNSLFKMILYTYSTLIAGILLLWVSLSLSNSILLFYFALGLITMGQAGEDCVRCLFGDQLKSEEESQNIAVKENKNRTKVKLFIASTPAIVGAAYMSMHSWDQTFKISTMVMVVGYNLFFWFGTKFYKNKDALIPELKQAVNVLLRLFPLWLTFILTCCLVGPIGDTLFIVQVENYVDKNSSNHVDNNSEKKFIRFPESSFYVGAKCITFATSQCCGLLIKKCRDDNQQRYARLVRISAGMLFSSLCCLVASLVETHRLHSGNSFSIFWFVPQFVLLGLTRGLVSEGIDDFLSDHLPSSSMKFHVLAVNGCAEGLGCLLNAILILACPSNWINTSIKTSHISHYYMMLAIINLGSLIVFITVANIYKLYIK